ncbi:TlpA disulfide reductase family protein [Janibacter cremeus]|uniref:TlpA family protein disulfide reductase n=1 Tax=Janibacter cremeus TaxID=1285192 RepID=UPI0023F71314|nr:TlpA disulfide reductase family protein [Janibacter cremeus]WEV78789.1 TlpA disulfide reductase family protein [Janibacter cremeus]
MTEPRTTEPRNEPARTDAEPATTTTRRKAIKVAAAAAIIGGGAFAGYRTLEGDAQTTPNLVVGEPAPALSGPELDGGEVALADFRGDVVLVNVWASWCYPCRAEYPVLKEAATALGPRGLTVLGINTQDGIDEAREFLEELGGKAYPSIRDPNGHIAVAWATSGVPETFVIDPEGRVRERLVGEVTGQWVSDNVVPMLGD